MPQRVVDFLEAVEVDHQHRARQPRAVVPAQQAFQLGQRVHAVGQAGQAVVLGLVTDLHLAFGDAVLHAVERAGEVGEFVVADHGQRLGVVAARDPARRRGQPGHRARDAAADQHRHQQHQRRGHRGQQQDLPLQALVRLHRVVHVGQQDHVHGAGTGRVGGGHAQVEIAPGQRLRPCLVRYLRHRSQRLCLVGGKAGGHQSPAASVGHHDGGVQARERAVVAGRLGPEALAHRHPADPLRRHHRHDRQRIRRAVQHGDAGAVAACAGFRQQRRQGLGLSGRVAVQGAGQHAAVACQQQGGIRTDPPAVVEQCGQHGGCIAGGDRLAEREVRRQCRHGLRQFVAAVHLQLVPDAVAHVQARGQLAVHRAIDRHIDDQQRGRLHEQQDGHQRDHEPGAEAEASPAGHGQRCSFSRRNFSCSARSLSSAGVTGAFCGARSRSTVASVAAPARVILRSTGWLSRMSGCQTRSV